MLLIPSSFRISLSCLIFISLLQSTFLQNNFLLQTTFVATKCLPINCCFLRNYCCSVAKSCLTLCDPMDGNISGSPVLHYLLEFAQTHIHWIGDAIQPSPPLLSPSPPAFNLSSIRVFSNESALCMRWPKYWSFSISLSNEYSLGGIF